MRDGAVDGDGERLEGRWRNAPEKKTESVELQNENGGKRRNETETERAMQKEKR